MNKGIFFWASPPHFLKSSLLSLLIISNCGPADPSFNVEAAQGTGLPQAQTTDKVNQADEEKKLASAPDKGIGSVADEALHTTAGGSDKPNTGENGENGENGTNGTPQQYVVDDKNITIIPGQNEGGIDYLRVTIEKQQADQSKVDILWVIDNSGSMTEEQNYLRDNFTSFINKLSSQTIDFQIGITTTDVCQNVTPAELELRYCPSPAGSTPGGTHQQGKFIGTLGQQILKSGQTDLISRFGQYVQVGISGSGFEHGLKGADLAIQKVQSGENDPLLRANAYLAIIVVSDEEDDGIGISQNDFYTGKNYWTEGLTRFKFTEDDFIAKLDQQKGKGKYSISTITGVKEANGQMCTSPHSQPKEEGSQYIKSAQKSGGIVQSICSSQWDDTLTKIGQDLKAQISQITLEGSPDVATIKVSINGTEISQWEYVPAINAVKFLPDSIPAPGAQIKITYFKRG